MSVTLPGDAAPGLTYIGRAAEREDDDATGGGGVERERSSGRPGREKAVRLIRARPPHSRSRARRHAFVGRALELGRSIGPAGVGSSVIPCVLVDV